MVLNYTIHTPNDILPLYDIRDRAEIVKKGERAPVHYYNIPAAFDIETTSTRDDDGNKIAFMYVWMVAIDGTVWVGRYWDEFTDFIANVVNIFGLHARRRLPIYVHNLDFEFAFLQSRFAWLDMLPIKEHKPIYATTRDGIEFRCSYKLSGYALEKLPLDPKWNIQKQGNFDYTLKRLPSTPLTHDEQLYCTCDVLVLNAYIKDKLDAGDTVATIPLTSTGYARRKVRDNCLKTGKPGKAYRDLMKALKIGSVEEYRQYLAAYAGGDAHANAYHVNKTLTNCLSFDLCSDYPSIMVMEKFPMGAPTYKGDRTPQQIEHYINTGRLFVGDFIFTNLREKKWAPHHSIFGSKCSFPKGSKLGTDYLLDNGRLVWADVETTITLTDVDLLTHAKFYEWDDMRAENVRVWFADYLPTDFVSVVLELYAAKTTLKNVPGKELEYELAKALLNALYGMCGMRPVRDENTFDVEAGKWFSELDRKPLTDENEDYLTEQLEKFNNGRKRFIYPWWAVYVTAYARNRLAEAIDLLGDLFIYADTDSVKFINAPGITSIFDDINATVKKKMEAAMIHHGYPLDGWIFETIDNVKKPLGYWEHDADYDIFKTLGAKRYMSYTAGKLKITVAGLSKKSGCQYLETLGDVDEIFKKFDDGLNIPPEHSGRLVHDYITEPFSCDVTDYLGNIERVEEFTSCHLEPAPYSLGIAEVFSCYLLTLDADERA